MASATFLIPATTCPTGGASTAIWTGLGSGLKGNQLYQNGVTVKCDYAGVPTYQAFYDNYSTNVPSPGFDLSASAYPIAAGDVFTATVNTSIVGGHTNVIFTWIDGGAAANWVSPKWSATTSITSKAGAQKMQSECIVEDPQAIGGSYSPLADVGTVQFTDCEDSSGAALQKPTAIENPSGAVVVPSFPDPDTSFTTTELSGPLSY
jgi:hypothetical protein